MSKGINAADVVPGTLRVETRTEMPACEATILKLFEAGLVDWVGIEVEGALPFLFTRAALCPVCGQEHTWFVLRGEEVRCAACDKLSSAPTPGCAVEGAGKSACATPEASA